MPALDQMAEAVKAGQFMWIGGGSQTLSTCHVDKLCHALILAADFGRDGAAYFVSDGVDTTLRAFLTRLLASRGVTPSACSAPFALAWALAGAMEAAWRYLPLRGDPAITRQMLRLIGKHFTLDIARARAELSYAPAIAPEDGLRELEQGPPHPHDAGRNGAATPARP